MERRLFFNGLNELRAIAALSVVVHHIELYKSRNGHPSLFDTFLARFIANLGKNGVYLFFVLSGFLITYLLLDERKRTGKIHLMKFYIRRTLRIWPLYYLVVALAFLGIPTVAQYFSVLQSEQFYFARIKALESNFYSPLALFLFFLPNIALQKGYLIAGASQAWSVGVEEQFYLIWPHLLRIANRKMLFICFFTTVAGTYLLRHFSIFLAFLELFRIDMMAIGGITAYLLFYHKDLVARVTQSSISFGVLIIGIGGLLFLHSFKILLAISFGVLILFAVCKSNALCSRWLAKIGTISYGVYMLHPLVMFGTFGFLNGYLKVDPNLPLYHLLAYGIILPMTLLISTLSFRYYERPFLALKDHRFSA